MTHWPARFVYVCAASRGAAVNAAPLAHAGIGAVARVALLVGDTQRPEDERESIGPARDLEALLRIMARQAGLPPPPVLRHSGDPDDPDAWSSVLAGIAGEAAGDGAPLILNLTGGKKMTSIGAMLGCAGADHCHFLHVDGMLQPRLIGAAGGLLPRRAELSIDQYLAAYGMERVGVAASEKFRALCHREGRRIEDFARALLDERELIAWLNSAVNRLPFDVEKASLPITVNWDDRTPAMLRRHLADLAPAIGLEITNHGFTVRNPLAVQVLLLGGWLEAALFVHVSRYLAGISGVSVDLNVRIREAQDKQEDCELDVVVMAQSRPHVIEAKSGNAKSAGKWLQQMEHVRGRVVGLFTEGVVVNVRGGEAERRQLAGRAARARVDLLMGDTAAIFEGLNLSLARIVADLSEPAP